jgi:hypothetical protein
VHVVELVVAELEEILAVVVLRIDQIGIAEASYVKPLIR